jgi:hypothetical protein
MARYRTSPAASPLAPRTPWDLDTAETVIGSGFAQRTDPAALVIGTRDDAASVLRRASKRQVGARSSAPDVVVLLGRRRSNFAEFAPAGRGHGRAPEAAARARAAVSTWPCASSPAPSARPPQHRSRHQQGPEISTVGRGSTNAAAAGRGHRVEAAEAARIVEAGYADVDGALCERGLYLRRRQCRIPIEKECSDAC